MLFFKHDGIYLAHRKIYGVVIIGDIVRLDRVQEVNGLVLAFDARQALPGRPGLPESTQCDGA